MSGGTSANISSAGGVSLPQPMVRIETVGQGIAQHDIVHVGGLQHSQFEAIKDLNPEIWLYRYKRGFDTKAPHSGYLTDGRRGYVHPANWNGTATNGRHVGGGNHTSRQGATIPARQTEWLLTNAHRYDAIFNAELWFLDNQSKAQNWPIVPIATANGNEHSAIGMSGQGKNNTLSAPDAASRSHCNSTRSYGTQVQWFAFAVVCDSKDNPRNKNIGPLSEPIRAEIWPRVNVGYGSCPPRADRGRKIRVIHA